MPRKNLVIGVVGDDSQHSTWIANRALRTFDLCLVYYGNHPGRYANDAERLVECKGIKYNLLGRLFQTELADLWPQYSAVWLPDDDLAASTETVNRLFALATEYRLAVAQPAIGGGQVSFRGLRAQREYVLRYTQFVEMQCPVFSQAALRRLAPLFLLNRSGWGLDRLWSTMFPERQIAVLDSVVVDHTRPVRSGGVHTQLQKLGIDPEGDQSRMIARFSLENERVHKNIARGTGRWRAIATTGEEVWTQPVWNRWLPKKLQRRCAA